ncbi:hypothetical protein V0R50_26960 [Pseudomonas sp. 148P]|uniref:DUF4234 domain-containing protein n=1 Tax=Pseudomonas ulcerans TaxID=3115852 RepID=A0ABU7HZ79_9PSED|nr:MULTISPECIES: hypothetical protein [unclassified Pseudomonas]MEE1925532.1 hypothetical protein [Pseudomonas sp. 147P]MEE1936880.1 hypothetical protein [Pseudomonas sp. 148P]
MSSDTITPAIDQKELRKPMFYVVSVNKLIYMTILTTGLYGFYWFYRNWATYRDATGEHMIPLLRSIIPVIFLYPLLRRIDQGMKGSGSQYEWSPKSLAMAMWLILLASFGASMLMPVPMELKDIALTNLQSMILAIAQLVALLWVMCKIQRAVNVVEGDPEGETNAHFNGANKGWMGLGIVIWLVYFVLVAMLLSLAY